MERIIASAKVVCLAKIMMSDLTEPAKPVCQVRMVQCTPHELENPSQKIQLPELQGFIYLLWSGKICFMWRTLHVHRQKLSEISTGPS